MYYDDKGIQRSPYTGLPNPLGFLPQGFLAAGQPPLFAPSGFGSVGFIDPQLQAMMSIGPNGIDGGIGELVALRSKVAELNHVLMKESENRKVCWFLELYLIDCY
jgi:hypothetical protein